VGRAMRDRAELPDDVEEVLDFFDDVALLLKRDALDEEMTWAFFFAWLSRYVLASEAYVIEKQRHDPAVWRNVRPLFDRLLAVEETHTHHGREEIIASTRRGLTKWFEGEADLAPV